MIRLAVFDMAGTTVQDDDAVHQALIDAMAHFDLPVTREDANAVMGYPKPYAISKLLEQKQKSLEMVAEIYPVFESLMIEHYQRIQDLRPTYFAEECFDQLQNHDIKIGLDTGFSKAITEVIIKRLGWDHKVDAWVSSDMVEDGRPHPYMIEYLMEHTGVADNNQVAKIGDTISDILEGRNADVAMVISVTSGAYTREALEAKEPDYLAENLEEVCAIILDYNERHSLFQ